MPSRSVRIRQWQENRENKPRKPGNVYIVKLSETLYKVGKTLDLRRRLSQFRTTNIGADYVWSAYVVDMDAAENELHTCLWYRKAEREMFRLKPKDIRRAKRIVHPFRVRDAYPA